MWNEEDHEKLSNVTSITNQHYTFAEKLRDALQHSESYCTDSTDDSYAVDISISGSRTDGDEGIRYYQVFFLVAHIFNSLHIAPLSLSRLFRFVHF